MNFYVGPRSTLQLEKAPKATKVRKTFPVAATVRKVSNHVAPKVNAKKGVAKSTSA